MVLIEFNGMHIEVELKQRMDVRDFLAIADRLASLQGKTHLPRPEPPRVERTAPIAPPAAPPAIESVENMREEDFYLDKRAELDHLLQQMRDQNKRLESHDELIEQLLEYMQSMSERLNRR